MKHVIKAGTIIGRFRVLQDIEVDVEEVHDEPDVLKETDAAVEKAQNLFTVSRDEVGEMPADLL